MKKILTLSLIIMLAISGSAQVIHDPDAESRRLAEIEARLAELSEAWPEYAAEIDISVGRQPLPELLRNVARAAGVNLNVKGAEHIEATCNFTRAKITDLLYFLCREYGLDIDVVGNIVAISPAAEAPPPSKEIGVWYRISTGRLSFDLSGDRLADVTKKITELTGANFIVPQTLSEQPLSGHVREMPADEAIKSIAEMNGLVAERDARGVWYFAAATPSDPGQPAVSAAPAYRRRTPFSPDELSIDSLGFITAQIAHGDVQDIVTDLCEQQRLNYHFVTPVATQTSVWVRGVDFETLLDVLLLGTEFSYHLDEGIYIFGGATQGASPPAVEVVEMRYRASGKLSEIIPKELSAGVQITEFHDLNSVIVSGDSRGVSRVKAFLRSIDRRVPLVTIEVMIVDATKQRLMEIGIDAGFGRNDATSGGTLAGVDVSLNSSAVNSLINRLNGFGAVNIGKVGPRFYLDLQFLEDNGVIEMQSTPKLSTLNGHEATLTSGETRYYKEMANNYYGSQITMATESFIWKPIDANLEIKITPFVSEDRQITLDISIDQTEFTAREEAEAPPGTATRSFKSLIRVRNEEMVLLGGIDQNLREKNNRGLPWIARVPVLRWFFGKSRDNKSEHRLNVFIKPTLVE